MKILAITAYFPPHHKGGYELRCKDVLEGLRQAGHEILLITDRCINHACQDYQDESWVIRFLNLQQEERGVFFRIHSDNAELLKIQKVIRSFQPDLLYPWHLQNLSEAILPFLARQGIPLVHDEGGSELIYLSRLQKRGLYFYKNGQDSVIKRFLKQGIKAYARLVSGGRIAPDWEWPGGMCVYFNSQAALEHAREMGVAVEGAVIIPSGIDISKFPFQPREKFNSPVKILIPARIKEQKGCKDGILLVDELRKRNILAQVLIIGEVQSEDYYDKLMKITHDLELSESVKIQKMVSQAELGEIYRETDICFFPSYFKTGFSRVPLEAMASGCLVITYGNEGSAESVRHGETGVILEKGDIRGAADWLERLTAQPSQYREMIDNARDRVDKNYSIETYIGKIESFLKASLNEIRNT
jgi:glycogen(starch) synthase